MAVLTSKTQAGGAIGDTFEGLIITRVIADTEYVWNKDNFIDDEVVEIKEVANEAARLAVTDIEVGDQRKQLDDGNIYELTALPASTAANWVRLTDKIVLESWTANEPVQAGEVRLLGGMIYTSNSDRTTNGTLDDTELAEWTERFQYGETTELPTGGPINVVGLNSVNKIDSSAGAFTALLTTGGNTPASASALIVVVDATNTVTFDPGVGSIVGSTTIPAATAAGTTYVLTLVDKATDAWSIQEIGQSSSVAYATAISPEADDATGAIGTSTRVVREDHKHPAQDVSSAPDNTLQIFAPDGLHYLPQASTAFHGGVEYATDAEALASTSQVHGITPSNIGALKADDIPPASDDATGSVGASSQIALEDHKHPAQAVSADADNATVIGTDDLHHTPIATDAEFTATTAGKVLDAARVIDEDNMSSDSDQDLPTQQSVKTHIDGEKVQVVTAAPVDGATRAYFVGQLFWDRVNKNMYEAVTASTAPYTAPAGSTFAEIIFGGEDRVFADDTTVSPSIAGRPSVAEIATFNGTDNRNTIVYYTASDISTDTPRYVFAVDNSGAVTLIYENISGDIIDTELSVGSGTNASTVERTQTFTTDIGGNVQTLGLAITSDTAADVATATIYQGAGTGGTVIGTLTATFAGTEVPATLTAFNATSGTIELDPNTQYTIGLVRTTGTGLVGWSRNNFDALPGEVSDQGAEDYIFRLTTLIQSAEGSDRVFADDTTVSPATAGSPTIAEINAFNAGGNLNSLVYYTGTDTVTDTPTHVYDVDASGIVTVLEEPGNDVPILYGTTDPVNGVTTADAVDQLYLNKDSREIFRALTLNTWQSVTNRILTPNADTALTADMNNAILQRTNTSGTAAFTINDVFPRGGVATFIQRAPELTTFVAGAGVTIFHPDGHTGMRAQYSVATITRGTVAGEYFLMGDTA